MVSAAFTVAWPVFGSAAIGISPSSMTIGAGDSGNSAIGTSPGVIVVVTPGPPLVLEIVDLWLPPPPPPDEPPPLFPPL